MEPFDLLLYSLGGLLLWTVIKNLKMSANRVSPQVVKEKMDNGQSILLVDVRSRGEYMDKHIPRSVWIPVQEIAKEAPQQLTDKNAEIYVYCASGMRSGVAVHTLTKMGYTQVYNLGGIGSWPYETVSGANK